ncbi:MAG: YebC/PmpR family DNA-binding transcriptional regulator, partial [Nautiliaceae bacterium]
DVDDETAEKVERLIEKLEEIDDVQNVIHNMA